MSKLSFKKTAYDNLEDFADPRKIPLKPGKWYLNRKLNNSFLSHLCCASSFVLEIRILSLLTLFQLHQNAVVDYFNAIFPPLHEGKISRRIFYQFLGVFLGTRLPDSFYIFGDGFL